MWIITFTAVHVKQSLMPTLKSRFEALSAIMLGEPSACETFMNA